MRPSLAAIAAVRPKRGRRTAKPGQEDILRRARVLQSEFNTVAALEYLKSHDIGADLIRVALLPADAV